MGKNGSGKTTLCLTLNGIIPHSFLGELTGTVVVNGKNTYETPVYKLSQTVATVLDDPETQLFTPTVQNEVAFALENLNICPNEIKNRICEALEVVSLSKYANYAPTLLSGGQKQRLAIACAIAMQCPIIVLDEPTSQLDPLATRKVFELLAKIKSNYNTTIIIATHESEQVAYFADKICLLKDGEVLALDKPSVVFRLNEIKPPQVSLLAKFLEKNNAPLQNFPITKEEAFSEIVGQYCFKGFRN